MGYFENIIISVLSVENVKQAFIAMAIVVFVGIYFIMSLIMKYRDNKCKVELLEFNKYIKEHFDGIENNFNKVVEDININFLQISKDLSELKGSTVSRDKIEDLQKSMSEIDTKLQLQIRDFRHAIRNEIQEISSMVELLGVKLKYGRKNFNVEE